MFPFRCSAEIESGASVAGTSELRSTSLQPGRSWWAASVLRRRLPICIVARSEAVACAPDRTSRLFRAVKKHRRRNLPRTPWDGLGVAESKRPPARKGGSLLADQPMVFLPSAQLAGCAVPFRCLVAGRGVEPFPWGLRPDAAGSRPYMPSGCAGRYSGIILIVGFVGFVLCFLQFCSWNFTEYIISENLQFFYM